MSTTITTMPTIGERAIITEYGYRTPATWVEGCEKHPLGGAHWCYDEPTLIGATWATEPRVDREPIPAPREWQAGDVVDHPKHGRGFVKRYDTLGIEFVTGYQRIRDMDDDGLTLVLAAPKPDEPTGLGAVVRDREGVLWVRVDGDSLPWRRSWAGDWGDWGDIDAVEVLSEGYTPKRGDDE